MRDLLLSATTNATAYAKGRADTEITPDDLLRGALHAIARLGVAHLGTLTIDLSDEPPVPTPNGKPTSRPRYSEATAALFDQASAIASADGERRVRLVHLLAALGDSDCELMSTLQSRHDFDGAEWRAALATWDSTLERTADPTHMRGPLMSVEDAATALGVHQQTIRGYIRSAKLPAYRIAGERAIRVFASDLYGLLEPVEPAADDDED